MGKARSFSNEANETVYQTESNNENFALGSQQNSYNLGSVHFSDQSGIGNFSQSGRNSKYVSLKGSTLQGNIGFVQQTVELDVGTSTINLNNDGTGAVLAVISQDRIVTLSAGLTSDLTTITGAQRPGQRVTLYNIFSNTITIKNDAGATVNTIVTPGASDFELSGHGVVTLVFDISLAQWRIEGNIGSGAGGSQTPWLQQIEGAGFTLNEAGKIIIKPIQTDGLAGILELTRNDTTPTDNDTVGQILFKGPDDIANNALWAIIEAESDDVINTTKQGQFKISVQHDNSLAVIIDYTGEDATFKFSSGVDVVKPNSNGSKELGTDSFFWDDVFSETFTLRGSGGNTTGTARTIYADSSGMIFNMPTSAPVFTHSVNNTIFSLLSDGELEVRTTLVDGPTLKLRNNDQTPTNADEAGTILFTGENSALDEVIYGAIQVQMNNVTAGATQANMEFRAQNDNSLKVFMNYLGDPAVGDDRINMFQFLDMNSNYIEFDDRSVPAAPASTERILFSDSTNSAHLTIRTDTGTIDLEAGGAGANTALSNLITTSINEDLLPSADNTRIIGSNSLVWGNIFTNALTSVNVISFENGESITSTSGGLELNVPTNDNIEFKENNVLTHFWSDFTNNIIRTSTGALGPIFQVTLDTSTPADNDILGIHSWGGRDSANNLQTYADIQGISTDVTSGSENGELKFSVAVGTGSLSEVLSLNSSGANLRIGFFGATGASQQTITGSRGGNVALADLLTSLANMGLIIDSTTA